MGPFLFVLQLTYFVFLQQKQITSLRSTNFGRGIFATLNYTEIQLWSWNGKLIVS